jgi:hypothetical protein
MSTPLVLEPCEQAEPSKNDWRAIAVYQDGSGKAGEYYDRAIATIEEWENVHKLHRLFLDKHAATLAGCYWSVAYLEAAIDIQHGLYRGKRAKPEDIAMLWPLAIWKRKKEKWTSTLRYNWEAVVDGMTLRIKKRRDGRTSAQAQGWCGH